MNDTVWWNIYGRASLWQSIQVIFSSCVCVWHSTARPFGAMAHTKIQCNGFLTRDICYSLFSIKQHLIESTKYTPIDSATSKRRSPNTKEQFKRHSGESPWSIDALTNKIRLPIKKNGDILPSENRLMYSTSIKILSSKSKHKWMSKTKNLLAVFFGEVVSFGAISNYN